MPVADAASLPRRAGVPEVGDVTEEADALQPVMGGDGVFAAVPVVEVLNVMVVPETEAADVPEMP